MRFRPLTVCSKSIEKGVHMTNMIFNTNRFIFSWSQNQRCCLPVQSSSSKLCVSSLQHTWQRSSSIDTIKTKMLRQLNLKSTTSLHATNTRHSVFVSKEPRFIGTKTFAYLKDMVFPQKSLGCCCRENQAGYMNTTINQLYTRRYPHLRIMNHLKV